MKTKAVSGIMLTLLLTSMLTLASPAKADPYAYDGPWDTDRWIILENTTLTNDVSFADWGIIIDADNITLDLNGYTVRGPGSGWDVGVRVNGRTGVTVKNGRIEGFRAGIGVYTAWVSWGVYRKSVDVTVEGNIVTDNLGDGIFLNAHDSTVIGNIVTNNSGVGVNISPDAARNTIRENYISNNGWGIRLQGGDYNSISANRITNNQYGIWFDSHQSIPITNSISGNNITANNGHGIHLEGSFRTSIFRNNITANLGAGIYLWGSIGETISGNNIINNYDGIYSRSAGNSISANNITANENYGILLEYSHDATLRNNKLANNKYNFGVLGIILDPMFSNFVHDIDASNTVDGKPIYYWVNSQDMNVPLEAGYVGLVNCTYITVQNLNLSNNVQGLLLAGTANSTIAENSITNNQYGVQLFSSSGNTVSLNKIANNNNRGVDLQYSSDNKFYHNNFIDNTQQVTTDGSSNVWDDGYPSGGNYWSDYEDRYPNAKELDDSGIWDTPYAIDENNQDNYSLMYPWGTPPPPSYILTIYSSPTGVTFTVDSVSHTTPWSETHSEGTSVSLVMQETHTVGDARYYWNQWSDGNTSRSRTVTINTNITLTAYYTGPYYQLTVTVDELEFNVVIDGNSTISDFDFRKDQKEISFSVTGPEGTVGFCNVTIPMDLMKAIDKPWLILVDGDEVTPIQSDNVTHTFLYFMYTHTTRNIIIRGTLVAPEFPTWTSILLILIVLTVVIAIYKRRLLKTPIH